VKIRGYDYEKIGREERSNMLESGDLRKGLKIEIDGEPYVIVQFEFTKPGKGQALYKCKLKNMVSGVQFDRTFRSGEKFKEPDLEEQEMEYLYLDGDRYCFMNTATYDQEFLTEEQIAEAKIFSKKTRSAVYYYSKADPLEFPCRFLLI
jgi:elongation factor P